MRLATNARPASSQGSGRCTEFSLSLSHLADLRLHVLRFAGTASLNAPYRFTVTALADAGALEAHSPQDIFTGQASFEILDPAGSAPSDGRPSAWRGVWHGVVSACRTGRTTGGWTTLELTLTPLLARLSGQIQNRVHLDSTSPSIIRESLIFGGVPAERMRFQVADATYPEREFVLQYGEDLLSFVLRTLEREGISLFWDQAGGTDVAVFADSNASFPVLADGAGDLEAEDSEVTGLEGGGARLLGLRREARVPVASVRLKDYSWERPNFPLEVRLPIAAYGSGEMYLYGENFRTLAEGRRLAALRGEEELADCERWSCESQIPGLAPGHVLRVASPGRRGAGRDGLFLVTGLDCSGDQTGLLASGLGIYQAPGRPRQNADWPDGGPGFGGGPGFEGEPGPQPSGLRQRLTLQRLDLPFRPRRVTPRPRVSGSLAGWIDGGGSGESPEMDSWGRYKVLLPLDVSGRPNGRASSWIRMAQPYVGAGYGQHFPLAPGTEVILTFLDGDPDRPIITGAVPNGETGHLVDSSAPHMSGVGTKGGGGLFFGNEPSKQNVTIAPGTDRGYITIAGGSPTAAAVASDVLDVTAVTSSSASFFHSQHAAGYRYSIMASEKAMDGILMVMSALGEAITTAACAAEEAGGAAGDEGTRVRGGMVANIAAITACATSTLTPLIQMIAAGRNAAAPAEKNPPNRSVVSLTADGEGGSAEWLSRFPFGRKRWKTMIARFMTLAKPLRNAAKAATNQVGTWSGEGEVEEEANETLKITSKAMAAASDFSSVLADIVSICSVLSAITKAGDLAPRGLAIENTDSYVDILAKGIVACGADGGPLILESSSTRGKSLADEVRRVNWSGLGYMLDTVTEEATGRRPCGYFDVSSAILLRGRLVRTLCEEASITGRKSVVALSPVKVQIAAGDDGKNPDANARSAQEEAFNHLVETPYDRDFGKGVDIEALDAGAAVRIGCRDGSGAIQLSCGHGTARSPLAGPECRQIRIDGDGLYLKDKEGGSLRIQGREAELLATDDARLGLCGDEVALELDRDCGVSMLKRSGTLRHGASLSVKGGQSTVKLDGSGIALDPGGQCKIGGKLVMIGD
ncbi:MAG: type VI secretion system tip protein VgrG [Deltaproteobacteria bacterium]|jgi:type VI secretion system VgrG family protein|nr:type VI secretion system tip protein VgrG [Deltaproteobacteria bacterium]